METGNKCPLCQENLVSVGTATNDEDYKADEMCPKEGIYFYEGEAKFVQKGDRLIKIWEWGVGELWLQKEIL